MKYNYVVFSWIIPKSSYKIEDDYYSICLRDLENKEGIIVNHVPMYGKPKLWKFLYRIHNSVKLNSVINLPFKSIWYPFVFENSFKDDKPICFVCIRYPSVDYLKYLRKNYPDCKIVVMCRDLLRIHIKEFQEYDEAKIYDYWMSFDENESKKYGFPHFDEFESKIEIPVEDNYPIADVFFAGRAKDRHKKLIDLYDKFEQNGVNCLFLLLDTPKEEQVKRKGIKYISKPISYAEMLKYTVNSKCVLEINQADAVGYTSRYLESVMFNKKLITDNVYLKNTKYYNPDYIHIFKTETDIDISFIKKDDIVVDYKYENDFSPINRIEQIDQMLSL